MNTKKLVLVLVLGAWIAVGSLAYAQYGTPSGTQANTVRDVTVPAGTAISVRTNEAVDSRNASEGQTFSAVVVDDVKGSSGEILIPKNSNAQLLIRKVATGGTTGSPELTLDLNSVSVNGRNYIVSTADVSKKGNSGIGKNKRTAEMVGGGAVLGTLLGAIAGGGKGAVIGAVAGAAAGGTAQVLTKGKEVKVPAETVLKFQLDQPVILTASY
jgi:outer membrane lipoprotein SlyB